MFYLQMLLALQNQDYVQGIKMFIFLSCNLVRLDDTQYESLNRPSHGLALYMKKYLELQKLVKLQFQSCEFIYAALHSRQKGHF